MRSKTSNFDDTCKSKFFVSSYDLTRQWDMKAGRAAHFIGSNPTFVRLGEYTEECSETVRPWDEPDKDWPIYGVNNKDGVFLNTHQKGRDFNAPYKRIKKDWFFHNPTRANVGSLGKVPTVPEDGITSPEYQVWRLTGGFLPEFMALLIRTDYFLSLVDFNRVGGVKQRMYYSNLAEIRLPTIPMQEQQAIADRYRASPPWFDDLPDDTLREISGEIYKSLQSGSHYLATFGSRTLIDRLIVLTVGDKGNFPKGLQALQDEGKLSPQEREILNPVVEAGNAAAHRGWAPTKEQLAVILDTVEGLIHRLLVLPTLAEELKEAVPDRGGNASAKPGKPVVTVKDKIDAAPKDVRATYDELAKQLVALGDDVSLHPQKHYMAFRRNRNFASVQVYNQKRVVRVYLNLDPDTVSFDASMMRDVRQIGHFGTGDLEITLKNKNDITKIDTLIAASYAAS